MIDMMTPLQTRDGLALRVRPADHADEAAIAAFFEGVSADDRRFRFLNAAPELTAAQIHALAESDHHHHENILAFIEGSNDIVAIATLAADAPRETAEVAISIRSDYKGRGIGWSLLDYVAQLAQDWGVKRLQAIENRENHAAIQLEREKGFVASGIDGDPGLVLLERRF